jgi:hypothetical protein
MKEILTTFLIVAPYAVAFIAAGWIKKSAERRRAGDDVAQAGDDVARAIAAFPCHWTWGRIWKRPGLLEASARFYPPDVIVECDDKTIELFKVTRVRDFERNDRYVQRRRRKMADHIRRDRCQKRAKRQAELEHEEYLRKRLAEQIRVKIDDLPPVHAD